MNVFIIILILTVFSFFIYLAVKGLKIEDKNDNNIPDFVEEIEAKVKEVVLEAKKQVPAKKRQVKKK